MSVKEEMTLSEAQEIVCGWMEKKPVARGPRHEHGIRVSSSKLGWWRCDAFGVWGARHLSLDDLREVEERLTEEQWAEYDECLQDQVWLPHVAVYWNTHHVAMEADIRQWLIHADATSKCLALAKVIGEPKREERNG